MHDLVSAKQVFREVLESLQSDAARAVKSITVSIGRFSSIRPEHFSHSFEHIAQDSLLEGAELIFTERDPSAKCRRCGASFIIQAYEAICPRCNTDDIEIILTSEIAVEHIEYERLSEGGG
ncbi:MAG: hydrogenase maturation nickel metallochaperone HypA [Candidatus Omnitrophica bacterium]|nr:hydrogenase maturation nickel metallochaperone HypA [Candidatus Omnitrophota bacterium]